jgi:hypothetical protein
MHRDLPDGRASGNMRTLTDDDVRRARLCAAANARDAEDLVALLQILGIGNHLDPAIMRSTDAWQVP